MNWKVHFDGQAFGGVDTQTDDILYIEQLFDYDPGLTDRSIRHGNALAAIGSFVLDTGYDSGFFRAGISRINDSIRTLYISTYISLYHNFKLGTVFLDVVKRLMLKSSLSRM